MRAGQWVQGFFFEFWGLSSVGGYNAPLGNQGRKKPCCFPQSGLILGPLRFCGAIGERLPCKLDVLGYTRRAALFHPKFGLQRGHQNFSRCAADKTAELKRKRLGMRFSKAAKISSGHGTRRHALRFFGAHFVALGFHTPWESARSKFGGGSKRCLGSLCRLLVELRPGSLPRAFQPSPSSSG